MDHAIERARAFAEAGADMVYVELLGSRKEVEIVGRRVREAPLLFDMFDHPLVPVLNATELESMGYKIVTFPFTSTLGYAKLLDTLYPSILENRGTAQVPIEKMELHDFEGAMGLDRIWDEVLKLKAPAGK